MSTFNSKSKDTTNSRTPKKAEISFLKVEQQVYEKELYIRPNSS